MNADDCWLIAGNKKMVVSLVSKEINVQAKYVFSHLNGLLETKHIFAGRVWVKMNVICSRSSCQDIAITFAYHSSPDEMEQRWTLHRHNMMNPSRFVKFSNGYGAFGVRVSLVVRHSCDVGFVGTHFDAVYADGRLSLLSKLKHLLLIIIRESSNWPAKLLHSCGAVKIQGKRREKDKGF